MHLAELEQIKRHSSHIVSKYNGTSSCDYQHLHLSCWPSDIAELTCLLFLLKTMFQIPVMAEHPFSLIPLVSFPMIQPNDVSL